MVNLSTVQREFFELVDDFFRTAIGTSPRMFATLDGFGQAIKADAQKIASRSAEAWKNKMPALLRFYDEHRVTLFLAARDQGGVKAVLGGSSRFGKTQLNAVRRLLLYSDTVLIPDPVLPWLEGPREEEKFRHVELLEAMFFLLRLKPLVDEDFGYPALIVFQSWERSLAGC